MWQSRTKTDLIVEVWEKLDCESVGRVEIEAIATVVASEYGQSAVAPPMVVARLLAEEGAELRHAEIMTLHVERASDRPYDAALREAVDLKDLRSAAASITRLENLRKKYVSEGDKPGIRLVQETGQAARETALAVSATSTDVASNVHSEIAEWFAIWLQTPEIFSTWLELRTASREFKDKFNGEK